MKPNGSTKNTHQQWMNNCALHFVEVCTEKQNRERKAQKYENGELAMEENYSFSFIN
jgi:invasion protein IalB